MILPLIDSLIPSPMKISSIKVPTNTKNVVRESHHADILSLPCERSSPRLGVVGGTPRPKKSKLVKISMAPLILKGRNVTTEIKLFGKYVFNYNLKSFRPSVLAALT